MKFIKSSVKEKNGGIEIVISDEGMGFDPKTINENGRFIKGFGLNKIREILKVHGCSLDINSKPGEGASFSLIIPQDKIRSNEQQS